MISYEKIKHSGKYADERDPFTLLSEREEGAPKPSNETLVKLWVFCAKLADFAATNPEGWETTRIKLDRPEASCREVAKVRGLTHPTVQKHLQSAARAVPELGKALGVDIRSNHKSTLEAK